MFCEYSQHKLNAILRWKSCFIIDKLENLSNLKRSEDFWQSYALGALIIISVTPEINSAVMFCHIIHLFKCKPQSDPTEHSL